MKNHGKVGGFILAVLIIIFAWYESDYSQWVITIAAAFLILHPLFCKCKTDCCDTEKPKGKKKK